MKTILKNNKKLIKENWVKSSPISYTKYLYYKVFGKNLNLKNPKGFNEKIQWLKFYYQHPLIALCADKYRMREYVHSLGLGFLLPKIYGVWQSSSEINWDSLPDKFAMKCNHGCCYNIICTNKNTLDIQHASTQLTKWLASDYTYTACELHYSKIKPLIFCEEFLEDESKVLPDDYKIYCFNGEPKVVLVCSEREPNKLTIRREFYDINWNVLEIGDKPNEQVTKKPDCLDDMINYARALAAPFPFIRVDFYDINSKPVLGELTFTPGAGLAKFHSETGDQYLGDLITLPPRYDGNYETDLALSKFPVEPLTLFSKKEEVNGTKV